MSLIKHHVATIRQPQGSNDCWAAVIAMLIGRHSNSGTEHVRKCSAQQRWKFYSIKRYIKSFVRALGSFNIWFSYTKFRIRKRINCTVITTIFNQLGLWRIRVNGFCRSSIFESRYGS
jgi:hypothetical protein